MIELLLEAFDNAECNDIECYASITSDFINEMTSSFTNKTKFGDRNRTLGTKPANTSKQSPNVKALNLSKQLSPYLHENPDGSRINSFKKPDHLRMHKSLNNRADDSSHPNPDKFDLDKERSRIKPTVKGTKRMGKRQSGILGI